MKDKNGMNHDSNNGQFTSGDSSKSGYPKENARLAELTQKNNGEKYVRKVEHKKENTPNVVKIDLDADIQKQFKSATSKERRKLAYRYIMDNLKGEYMARDGRVIVINAKSANEFINKPNANKNIKIKVAPQLAEVIQNSNFIETAPSYKERKDNFDTFAYYSTKIDIGGIMYSGIMNVGIDSKTNKAIFYDINPLQEIKQK